MGTAEDALPLVAPRDEVGEAQEALTGERELQQRGAGALGADHAGHLQQRAPLDPGVAVNVPDEESALLDLGREVCFGQRGMRGRAEHHDERCPGRVDPTAHGWLSGRHVELLTETGRRRLRRRNLLDLGDRSPPGPPRDLRLLRACGTGRTSATRSSPGPTRRYSQCSTPGCSALELPLQGPPDQLPQGMWMAVDEAAVVEDLDSVGIAVAGPQVDHTRACRAQPPTVLLTDQSLEQEAAWTRSARDTARTPSQQGDDLRLFAPDVVLGLESSWKSTSSELIDARLRARPVPSRRPGR